MRPASKEAGVERLKDRVKEAIKEEPELIYDALKRYEAEKRLELQILAKFEKALKNRVKWTVYDTNPQKGPADAPITLIIYTDFQCATCSRTARIMAEIMEAYPEKVRLVFKNNPEKSRPCALAAAKAGLAAHKQGKFWEYHDLLFEKVTFLNDRALLEYARDLGLDMKRFKKDRNFVEIAREVEADMEEAGKYGFKEPPAFIINGVVMKGMYPKKYFTTVIDYLFGESH